MIHRCCKNEHIAIIGSGINGCLAAFFLRDAGYQVTIIEERSLPFSGTSLGPVQLHLGGFYSASPETAQECLRTGIRFKRTLPFALRPQNASFFVACSSEVSMHNYLLFYRSLADYYGKLPPDEQVFGSPAAFYRLLAPSNYRFLKNVQGGIATQEPGLDMLLTGYVLVSALQDMDVSILTNHRVVSVQQKSEQFMLEMDTADGTKTVTADQVINAGGYKTSHVDQQLGDTTQYTLYLRVWNFVRSHHDISPFFVVRGNYIHYNPIRNGIALLTSNLFGASYVDVASTPPPTWEEIMRTRIVKDAAQRQQEIIQRVEDEFFPGINVEPYQMIPGIATSFSTDIGNRQQKPARTIVPGYITSAITKAPNALVGAEQVLDLALENSRQKGSVPKKLEQYPSLQKFGMIYADRDRIERQLFGKKRGWL